MLKEEYLVLVEKIATGTATAAEIALYNASFDAFQADEFSWGTLGLNPVFLEDQSLERFYQSINVKPVYRTRLWPRIAGAAAILLLIGSGLYVNMNRNRLFNENDILGSARDLPPGSDKAVLSFGNGIQINLSKSKTGVLLTEDKILYNDGSVLQADLTSSQRTISTPRGGQYQVTLPDGTKVWLNAASSLKFPATFEAAKQREVELTGEAYFEVTKHPEQPFVVSTGEQTVLVLGTHFNINGYADEAIIKTTLLEGLVRVSSLKKAVRGEAASVNKTILLKPGEQSSVSGPAIKISKADTEAAVAWKNALFVFDYDNLQSILKKVSRWYDVEIVYLDESVKNEVFSGRISRFENVGEVLKKLSLTGAVKFKVEGRRILVQK